ncbi:MAG: hypothetical protein RLZZ324_1261 [Candidatus Parcubacteria bacterium]|jgi:phosphoglycerate kinase
MRLKSLSQVKNLKGKRVLLRLDLNVPLDKRGRVAEGGDARIRASVPVVKWLSEKGARVIIVSHLGRPARRDPALSLAPISRRLATVLGMDVRFVADALEHESAVEMKLGKLLPGDVAMLENIRFHKGEETNGPFLARRLASLADVFVNDAFAVSHRAAASVVGVTKFLPSYAGPLMEKEVAALSRVIEKPKRPLVVMLGGAKVSDKIHVIDNMTRIADTVLVGGAMANAFLKAKGLRIGLSADGPADVRLAKRMLRRSNIVLPTDVVVSASRDGKHQARICSVKNVGKDDYIVDIGVESVRAWAAYIKKAKTLVWNGPLGMFEIKKFSHGSIALGRMVAARSSGRAFGVVGGGETVQCLEHTGMAEYVDHVSTGGGAMLDFLAGKALPGLLPLRKK